MGPVLSFSRVWLSVACVCVFSICATGHVRGDDVVLVEKLLNLSITLTDKMHYLEALDLLDEASYILENLKQERTPLYAETRYRLAQTKIKGRIHQRFPAWYVKSALEDVQISNKLREKMDEVLPQKMAEGWFLEGYIHKRFFMRRKTALQCFTKAVAIDPGFVAAKRELSELLVEDEKR
jgi:tetratricopeptide (TPR) repeat protein